MTSKHPKNQSKVNRCVNALAKYYSLNDLRDIADNNGEEKLVNKYNRLCEIAFDKYLNYLEELPKYEQALIEKL